MRRRATILSLLSLVVALAWPAGSSATAPNNQAASYEFFMEEPNVAMASNGDTISITGEGEFAVHPKSASGEGEFTAMSAGGQTVAGTWTVNGLVDFQPYGCGVIPSIGAARHAEKVAKWDIMIAWVDEGDNVYWRGYKLAEISKITLKYDRKSGETTAVTE